MDLETRKGVWWVPEREQHKVGGTLALVDDDIVLDLAGILVPPGEQGDLAAPIDRIVGVDEGGRHCVLLNCVLHQLQMSMPGPSSMSLLISMVIQGDDDTVHRAETFTDVTVEIDGLAELYNPSIVSVDPIGSPAATTGVRLESVLRDTLSAQLGDGRVISLVPTFSVKRGGSVAEPIRLTHSVSVRVELKEAEPVDAILGQHVKPIVNLVRLGVDRRVEVSAMQVRAMESDWADVFFVPNSHRGALERRGRGTLLMFEGDSFTRMIQSWFAASARLSVVFDLYFATAYGYPMYAESRFLSLAQAIEAYDRITTPTKAPVRERYASRLDHVYGQLAADDQDWLRTVVRDPSQFEDSARKRFNRCLGRYQAQLGMSRQRRSSVVQRLLATRNFLTHWDERGASAAASGLDLLDLTNLLRVILRALLLEEAGVDPAQFPPGAWHR